MFGDVAGNPTPDQQDDKAEKALLKVPRLFRDPRVAFGTLVIVVQNGSLKSQPKGIDPKLQCGIRVEGGAGETEPTLPSKQEWNVEFQFPVSHYSTEVEVSLNTSRVDLVTQETRWIKQASTTIAVEVSEYEPWPKEPKEYELQLKKGGKGRPAGTVNLTMRFVARDNRWLQLEKFILSNEKLVQEMMAADTGGESQEAYAKALLLLFWYNARERELLRMAVHHEIYTVFEKMDDITQLLRGPTLSAMVLSEFMHIVCDPYLVDVVVPLIRPLAQNPQHFEVDPSKLDPATSEKDLKRNQKGLHTIVNKFLKKIISSANKFPPDMGELCRLLKDTVNARFPDNPSAWTIAMGALIFLRFICPAIVAPDTFGLIQAECGTAGRRCLVLVTKVLQNLVNDVEFKTGYKEEYMTCMNPFLEKNKTKPVELYNNILKRKEGSLLEPTVVRRAIDEQTYITLWKVIDRTADKLAQNLGENASAFLGIVNNLREAERKEAEAKEAAEKEAEAKQLRKEKREAKAMKKKEKRATKPPDGEAAASAPEPNLLNSDPTRKQSMSKEGPPHKKSPKEEGEANARAALDESGELPKSPKGKKKGEAESPAPAKKKNKQSDALKKDKSKKRGGSYTKAKGKGEPDEAAPTDGAAKDAASGEIQQEGAPPGEKN